MVENPQLECLPEHKGPALNTWQLIVQTAMEKSMQTSPPSELQVGTDLNFKKLAITPEELIPIKVAQETVSSTEDSTSDTCDEMQSNRRKSVTSSCSVDSNEEAPCKIGVAPWKSYYRYPENTHGLHLEIIDFYRHISPLPEEEVMRQDVVQRMHELITRILPGAKVEVFGSFETCLYLPSSDIDLAVFGDWDKLPLFALKEGLISSGVAEPNSVMVLDKASVPIVKLRDKHSKVRVDISFNTDASVKSVAMIKSYLKKFPLLPYIFLTLKHFLVQRDLNEVFTGGISSYCLLLLTVSFFQFQRARPHMSTHQMDLGVLLMEFLELYGRNLNYQRIGIKIKDGGCYINKDKLTTDLANGEYPALLCIEDPVTLATDIGKSSYGILRVKEAFEYAFNVIDIALRTKWYFKVNPNSTYLSRIISITQDLYDYRRWVRRTYRSMLNISRTLLPRSIYHHNISPLQGNDGKPPLLPTPTVYSPTMQLSTPPFSPFTTSTNGILFNQVGFITNSKIITHQQLPQQSLPQQQQHPQQSLPQQQLPQQVTQQQVIQPQLIVGNITTIPTCVQNKENLSNVHVNHLNSNYLSHLANSNSVPCLPPIGYVLPQLVTTAQVEQVAHKQSPSYSIMKTKTNNSYSEKSHGNQALPRQQDYVKNRSNDNVGVVFSRSYSPKSTAKLDTKNMQMSSKSCNGTTSNSEDNSIDYFNDAYKTKNNLDHSNKEHYADRKKGTNERIINVEDNTNPKLECFRKVIAEDSNALYSPAGTHTNKENGDLNVERYADKKKGRNSPIVIVDDDVRANLEHFDNSCDDGIDVISISSGSLSNDE